jgi:hypothetical protein
MRFCRLEHYNNKAANKIVTFLNHLKLLPLIIVEDFFKSSRKSQKCQPMITNMQ